MSAGRLRALLGLVVAAFFLALLIRGVKWTEVRGVLAGADWLLLAAGLVALSFDLTARIARWWLMLRAHEPDLPLASCVRPFLASLALNNTMPLRAGDVVRVFGFRGSLRAPAAHVAGTLLLERMLDLVVLLLILFATMWGAAAAFPREFTTAAGMAGLFVVTTLVAVTAFPYAIAGGAQRMVARLFRGRSWLDAITRTIAQVAASLSLLRSPRRALMVGILSIVAWLLEGAVFACAVWALHLPVPSLAPWLSLAMATIATLLPSSPGYVGTFDYFAVQGLTAYEVPVAGATAFALLAHLMLWLPVTTVGLGALALSRRRMDRGSASEPPLEADTGVPA